MKKIIIFIVCYLIGTIVYAQTPADSVPLDYNGLRETVYLQTSKGVYETGEDLWFKAYAFDAQDGRDSIVWQEKYPIHVGMAEGHIYVDKSLRPGDYRIHAYTRHSFLRDTLMPVYPKVIRIVKEITDKLEHKEAASMPDTVARLRFFPEGGDLVDGIPSKVAFKATDYRGMPVSIEGILEENGRAVARLESLHDGMGSFMLLPHLDATYKAVLSNGREFSFCPVKASGLSLQLHKQTERFLDFQLTQPEDNAPQTVRLVGRMRGMTCCTATATLHGSVRMRMPMETFTQQGIAEFTLYDEAGRPMAERLVYVHPQKRLHVKVKPNKIRYWKREKGTLKIRVTDEHGRPVQANLTLSLFKAYVNEKVPENLLSYCFLSTEIRGNIHNPAYYFDERNKDRLKSLDLLLLTQGWRRYVWEERDTVTSASIFLHDEINGVQTIGTKKGREEVEGMEQFVQVFGPEGNAEMTQSDASGYFVVSANQMEKLRGGYVYIKPLLDKDRYKPSIAFEDLFGQADSLRKARQAYCSIRQPERVSKEPDYLRIGIDGSILLSEVTVTAEKARIFRDKFMGRLDSLAQADLNGAWVCDCTNPYPFLNDYKGYSHHPACCPYDGKKSAPVIGESYELIKYEPVGPDGVWIVTDIQFITYDGPEFTEEELLRMNNIYRTKGYYGKREFYQPDIFDMRSPLPDARNTLLWLPNLMTDENGEAEAEFYCSDINTGFIGVVEGTDGQGLLGTGQCEFRVVRN